MVYLYTNHQALEPSIKSNRAYQQYSAGLTRWLDRLAHFDISIKHTAQRNLLLTGYLSRHPTQETTIEETHDEEYVSNIFSKLNHKYGQPLNTGRKIRATDPPTNMTLTKNREPPMKLIYRRN